MCFLVQAPAKLSTVMDFLEARALKSEFNNFINLSNVQPKQYKKMEDDGKTYPGYFAPVVSLREGMRVVSPMRYRVRPSGSSSEVPSKYNVFNARRDSLYSRQTWKGLIGRNHGIFLMEKFYEWVEDENKKKVMISFNPSEHEYLVVPCLYDQWINPETGENFYSFAVITDEPPSEVLAAGHDRCPVNLDLNYIDQWLDTSKPHDKKYWDELLDQKVKEYYQHSLC